MPRYAGRHYFADPGRLRASVESFVEDAAVVSVPGSVCAVIVPHGAHPEFGPVAGHAYKLLLSVPLTSALTVLLAPAAAVPDDVRAVLCDPSGAYATPLDLIGIAAPALHYLDRAGIPVRRLPDEDPMIENHLPFVQIVTGDTQCLPLRIPAGADLTAPGWDAVADEFGLIIAVANLPQAHEQAACAAVERLDARFFVGDRPAERPGGLKGLFGTPERRPLALSADTTVLALVIRLAKAKGARYGRLLARQGQRAAFVLYR